MHNQRRSRKQFRTPLTGTGLTAVPSVAPRRWGRVPALPPLWRKTRRGAFWAVNPTVNSTLGLRLVMSYVTEIDLELKYHTELRLTLAER